MHLHCLSETLSLHRRHTIAHRNINYLEMKYKLIVMSLLASIFNFLGCAGETASDSQSVGVDEFEKLIAGKNVLCLDVRTAAEYEEGHITGALNIDVQRDDFDDLAEALLPKDMLIAVYCRSGRRSKTAVSRLTAMGYRATDLSTGFTGWTEAGKRANMQLAGGYSDPRQLTGEDRQLFARATANLAGGPYTPLFVRTQVVAGLNYAFVCREGVNITIYAPLPGQGEPRVTSTVRRSGQGNDGKAE